MAKIYPASKLSFTSEKKEQTSLVEMTGVRMIEVLRDAGLDIPEDFIVKIATDDGSCTLGEGPCVIYVMQVESSGQFSGGDDSPSISGMGDDELARKVQEQTEQQLRNLAAARSGSPAPSPNRMVAMADSERGE